MKKAMIKDLEESIQKEAYEEFKRQRFPSIFNTFKKFIESGKELPEAFVFSESKQGFWYWDKINDNNKK